MQINPPFGYQEIAPFLRNQRVKLPQTGTLPAFTRQLNAIPVSFTEFNVAHRDYPLVFSSGTPARPSPRWRCWAWKRAKTCLR